MAADATVDMLLDIVAQGAGDFHSTETPRAKAPANVKQALEAYVESVNISMSDVDDDSYHGQWFDDERGFWVFTFSGTDPDPFGGTVIIGATAPNQLGVVGESFLVGS